MTDTEMQRACSRCRTLSHHAHCSLHLQSHDAPHTASLAPTTKRLDATTLYSHGGGAPSCHACCLHGFRWGAYAPQGHAVVICALVIRTLHHSTSCTRIDKLSPISSRPCQPSISPARLTLAISDEALVSDSSECGFRAWRCPSRRHACRRECARECPGTCMRSSPHKIATSR